MRATIIGLTGRRQVGKSTIANMLVEEFGFQRVHPFDGGKAMCMAMFERYGATADEAYRMVNGDLKDTASDILPGRATPRDLMEPFGKFMGVEMGPDWTISMELKRILRAVPDARLVVESVVYEVDALRDLGGAVAMVTRAGSTTAGLNTDAVVAGIDPDFVIANDGNDLSRLRQDLDEVISALEMPERDAEMAL